MSTRALLDPEIVSALDGIPEFSLSRETLPAIRKAFDEVIVLSDPRDFGIEREEIVIPAQQSGSASIRCLIYRPSKFEKGRGAYLNLHGGGFIMGSPEVVDPQNAKICSELGIVVISVDYRLAPEHPVPAALEDAFSGLVWMHENAQELGIDSQRIAVGGESAGAGLAAALVLYAQKRPEYSICAQLLTYPMLDDRTGDVSNPGDPLCGEFIWTRENNQLAWSCYLGDAPAQAPYVPARAEDLSGLPPTWINTASLDLFRDENIAYAQRLLSAGVNTELTVYPRTYHGYQMANKASITKRYMRDFTETLGRALGIVD